MPVSVATAPRPGVVFRPIAGQPPRLPVDLVSRDGDLPATAAQFVAVAREPLGSGAGD